MARIFADRVREITMSTGTGPLTLAGVPTVDYLPWSVKLPVGETAPGLVIAQGRGQWEVVDLTMLPDGRLDRSPTPSSSSNSGAPVSFGPGRKEVILVATAADIAAAMDAVAGALAGQEGAEAARDEALDAARDTSANMDAPAYFTTEAALLDYAPDNGKGAILSVDNGTRKRGIYRRTSGAWPALPATPLPEDMNAGIIVLNARTLKVLESRYYLEGLWHNGRLSWGIMPSGRMHIPDLLLDELDVDKESRYLQIIKHIDALGRILTALGMNRATGRIMALLDDPAIADVSTRSGLTALLTRSVGLEADPAVESRFKIFGFDPVSKTITAGVDRATGLSITRPDAASISYIAGKLPGGGGGAAAKNRRWQVIANRGHPMRPNRINTSGSFTVVQGRMMFTIGPMDCSEIKLVWSFGTGAAGLRGEQEWPNAVTIKAALETYDTNLGVDQTIRKVSVAGNTDMVIKPGANAIISDGIAGIFLAGARHYIRTEGTVASGSNSLPVTYGGPRYSGMNESFTYFPGAAPSSVYATGAMSTTGGTGGNSDDGLGPQAIIGIPVRPIQAWGIFLCSIESGVGDNSSNLAGARGYVTRGLRQVGGVDLPWVDCSIPGATYKDLRMGNNGARLANLEYSTVAFFGGATNDIIYATTDGITLADIKARMLYLIRMARAVGNDKVGVGTVCPITDVGNTTPIAGAGNGETRDQLNTWLRGLCDGAVDFCLDVAAAVENPSDHTLWASTSMFAGDGVHPSSTGAIAMSALINAKAVELQAYFAATYPAS